jgi:hypothetical protein
MFFYRITVWKGGAILVPLPLPQIERVLGRERNKLQIAAREVGEIRRGS